MGRSNVKKDRVGERFVSREGCTFFIVEYNNRSDVTVKFCDEHEAEVHTNYQACQNGLVKNPYFKSLFGVACLGEGAKTIINGKRAREYFLWTKMLNRCYSGKYSTYANVTVCDRWLVYANFLEDLPKIENYELWINNPSQRIALDKDIKQQGIENKVYSLETCKFVTISENSKEVHERG